MTTNLLDTHIWYWLFADVDRLPEASVRAIENADTNFVSSISVYEIARKAKIGKWPEMDEGALDAHIRESDRTKVQIVPATTSIMSDAGFLEWDHRDPWDRMIAATALDIGATLVTADPAFGAVKDLKTIWR